MQEILSFTHWSEVYAVAVALTLCCAFFSNRDALQKLAAILLLAWGGSNYAVTTLGFGHAAFAIPTLDAAMALLVAVVGWRHRSRTALVVFGLYAAVGIVHVSAFIARMEETYGYYAALNLLFLAQLLAVGATSAWVALHSRPVVGRERLGGHRARWPDLG